MRPYRRRIYRLIAGLGVVTLALWMGGVRLFAFPGISMIPAVNPGDHFLGLVGPWGLRPPERFDMVIFDVPSTSRWAGQKIPWMKRVVGLPGERVRLVGQDLFIDGRKMDAPFLHVPRSESAPREIEVALGKGEFFVLGDNLANSFDDSRSMGPIDRALIRGFVAFVFRTSTHRKDPQLLP